MLTPHQRELVAGAFEGLIRAIDDTEMEIVYRLTSALGANVSDVLDEWERLKAQRYRRMLRDAQRGDIR